MEMKTAASGPGVARAAVREPARGLGTGRMRGHPTLTLLTVALGVMMVALDGTIVAVANPAIQADLHASLAGIQWVTNAYLLALAVSLITIGKLGDRFGHKKVFLTGVTGFALSSAAIGLSGTIAGSIGLVIGFRVLQGVFGAMLQPSALALLRATFPAEKLNGAIGVWGAVIGASTAAGPIVGGLLVQHISWESCFYVNIPVGIAALTMSLLVLRETPSSPAASSFDIPGIATLSGALFLLIWGLIKGSSYGWGSPRTLAFLVGAVVVGLLFVLREHRTRQPLLPLRLFRSASLSAGTGLVVLLMFALFGAMFFMTFYLENVHGLDPVAAGVRLLPMTGMLIVGAPLSGLAISRVGPRLPIVTGMVLAAVALFGLSLLTATSSPQRHHRLVPAAGPGAQPGDGRRHRRHRGQRAGRAVRRGRRPAVHRHAGRRDPRHRRARRGDVRPDQHPAAGLLARRGTARVEHGPAGPGRRARSRWAPRRSPRARRGRSPASSPTSATPRSPAGCTPPSEWPPWSRWPARSSGC